jgi:hypothetical protein
MPSGIPGSEIFSLLDQNHHLILYNMKTLVTNIQSVLTRIAGNIWPMAPKQVKPARVMSPGVMHPAAVNGGSRNYPPSRN